MMSFLKVACVQMNSGPVIEDNLKAAEALIRKAAAQGAQLIATPENTCHIRFPSEKKLETALDARRHIAVPYFLSLAKELGVWLLIGSISVRASKDKLWNRSYLFSDEGKVVAMYDKIHLFDSCLPSGEVYKESNVMRPGRQAVVAHTPWGGVGLSICYDLRFSTLYRNMAKQGAKILMIPAAFTVPTGKAHWEILLRARAIETGCFVIAPGQTGEHENGRRTWGHSMIIGPWGNVISAMGEEVGIITAELDLDEVRKTREALPALEHDRFYKLKKQRRKNK